MDYFTSAAIVCSVALRRTAKIDVLDRDLLLREHHLAQSVAELLGMNATFLALFLYWR